MKLKKMVENTIEHFTGNEKITIDYINNHLKAQVDQFSQQQNLNKNLTKKKQYLRTRRVKTLPMTASSKPLKKQAMYRAYAKTYSLSITKITEKLWLNLTWPS
jgi:deoxyribodipyrimidine photolyase-like uncharacterized protein